MISLPIKFIGIPYKYRGRDFAGCDCYGAILLYYQYVKELYKLDCENLPDPYYTDSWYKEGKNYFLDLYATQFDEISEPELHCLILMKVHSCVPNHCAVYVGENRIFQNIERHCSGLFSISYFKHSIYGYYRWRPLNNLVEKNWQN